MKKAAQ